MDQLSTHSRLIQRGTGPILRDLKTFNSFSPDTGGFARRRRRRRSSLSTHSRLILRRGCSFSPPPSFNSFSPDTDEAGRRVDQGGSRLSTHSRLIPESTRARAEGHHLSTHSRLIHDTALARVAHNVVTLSTHSRLIRECQSQNVNNFLL